MNVLVYVLPMMERVLFQDGLMEKSELFYLNRENFFLSLMTLITMGVLQLPQLLMDKELFQEAPKEKSEFGR